MRYTQDASNVLLCAAHYARTMGHSHVGSAHLLLALTSDFGWTGQILQNAVADVDTLALMIRRMYGTGTPELMCQGFSDGVQRILLSAARESHLSGKKEVSGICILLSTLRCENTAAQEILIAAGVDRDEAFTRAIEFMQWETYSPNNNKKEAVATKLLEQFSEYLLR